MDIRVLQYFLAVAREESITAAAERLHMTQPPLSRQLKDLEDELGKQLFIRGNRKITLTEEGLLLRKRAEEMIKMMEKTKSEIRTANDHVTGDIYIGASETDGVRIVAKTIEKIQKKHPGICFHFFSDHAEDITDRLDRGLIDFGIFIEPADMEKYEFIKLPSTDIWGVLMRKDSPLAANETIKFRDLLDLPIIISNQAMVKNEMAGWSGGEFGKLNIVATYNLPYNASLLVEEHVGYALCLDKIIHTSQDDPLCFRPLEPKLEVGLNIGWKKYQIFTKAAQAFISQLQEDILTYHQSTD